MKPAPESIPHPQALELVGRIGEIASRFRLVSLNRQIDVCRGLVQEKPLIDIAILGQFKAGKSSFINSLLDREILPVGVIPVTTVITRLQYGHQEQARITYIDGSTETIRTEDLNGFISEAFNPSNKKNVDVVDIDLPALRHYPGLRLVDTPGMGSVFKYHKEVSENWLPEVGAAILAVSADRPLSEHDMDLLEDLARHTPRIVLLLTKADLLSSEQQEEVLKFFRQILMNKLGREYPLFLYSTKEGTGAFRERISSELLSDLSANRTEEFGRILNHKISSLARGCVSYLSIALKTSLDADHDRESLRRKILDERVNFETVSEEMGVITRECQRQTRTGIARHLEKFRTPLTDKMRIRLTVEMPSWKGNLWKLSRKYESWVAEFMEEEIRTISKSENKRFYGTLDKAHTSLTRYLEAFRMQLDGNIRTVLGIGLAETDWKIEVVEPEKVDIKVLYSFDIHLDLIWFLIPMFIFRRLFERHFLKGIPWAVEVNLSRLVSQWENRINRAIDEMRAQAEAYIKNEVTTIETLLSESHGQTSEIRELILEIGTW